MNRNSRMLKIVVPITLILLIAFIYEYGYVRIEEEEATLADTRSVKRKTLEKYVTMISQKPILEKTLSDIREKRKAENNKLFEGQTPALASAALQNTVKTIITERGGTISSERVEKPEDFGRMKVVAVTFDAIMPGARALTDTIYAIETHTQSIIIRELDTRVRNFREPKDMMVRLTVAAMAGGR